MRTWAKVTVGIFATIGVLYVGLAVLASFLAERTRTCTTYPVLAVSSPTGKWRAEQNQETCNDDNQLKTVIWISDGRSVNIGGKRWSAFRAISSQPAGAPGVYEPLRLQIVWLSDSELQISHPQGIDVQHSERTEYGVRVKYRELETSFH